MPFRDFQRVMRGLQRLFPAARGSYGDLTLLSDFVQPVHDPFRAGFAAGVRHIYTSTDGQDGNITSSFGLPEPSKGTWHLPVMVRVQRELNTAAVRLRLDAGANAFDELWGGMHALASQFVDEFTPVVLTWHELAHFPIPTGHRWTVHWSPSGVGGLVNIRYLAWEIPGELITVDRLLQSIRR